MNSQNKFKVISTFSGCGGSSLGYKLAGGEILLAVEMDDNAVQTYKLNFPETPIYHGDIHNLTVEKVLEITRLQPGELDILDGSPPCQGFSTAGKREFCDPRNQLYNEYLRLLKGLKPKVFVMENVSGLVKGKMKVIFRDILTELKQAGYNVKVRLMNAKYYNVPQSRQRLIFIGVQNDLNIIPSHPKPQTKPIPISNVIGNLGNIQNKSIDHIWINESPKGKNTKNYHRAKNVKQGESYKPHRRKLYWNEPSDTITTGGGKLNIPPMLGNTACHPLYTRTLSLLELKRIASFPDDFDFKSDLINAQLRMGNSVPPLFMKAIAEHIKKEILMKI